jgi:nicotinamide-nucleotide amidase
MTSPFDPDLVARAGALIRAYAERGWMIATAESCTGGLVGGLLTEIAGSSAVVDRGFITYSNEAKQDLLGVPADLLAAHGAVSAQVAIAMAEGALQRSRATVTVAITGIAGPGGGTADKPVGLVHFASAQRGLPTLPLMRRFGDLGREAVRHAAVEVAFATLEARLV